MIKVTEEERKKMREDPMYYFKYLNSHYDIQNLFGKRHGKIVMDKGAPEYYPSIFTLTFWCMLWYPTLCFLGFHDWTIYKDHVVTHKNYDGMILTWRECERCSASKLIAINRRIANPIIHDSVKVINRKDRIE